jgi:hypothetical protein
MKSAPALLLFALSAIWIQPAAAQSQDGVARYPAAQDKLQQLDQMMSEVKGEIRALEDAQGAVAPAADKKTAEGQRPCSQGQ